MVNLGVDVALGKLNELYHQTIPAQDHSGNSRCWLWGIDDPEAFDAEHCECGLDHDGSDGEDGSGSDLDSEFSV